MKARIKSTFPILIAAAFSGYAEAATYTWNTSGATDNWNTADANWTGGGSIWTDGNDVTFGAGTGETVTLNTAATVGILTIANNAASYTINGSGSINITGTGTSVSFQNSGAKTLTLGVDVTNSGTLNIRGGASTLTLNAGADWVQGGNLTMQSQASNTGSNLNVKDGATFTYNGINPISLSAATGTANGTANLNLDGGIFATKMNFNNGGGTGAGSSANVTFSSGGTLRLTADITSTALFTTSGVSGGGTVFNVKLGAKNSASSSGIIDTNGFNTTITQGISDAGAQPGSLTKLGAGTLTLSGANTYTGATTVNGGTLAVSANDQFSDSAALSLTTDATLALNHAGTDTVSNFRINGDTQATGIWGAIGSGAPYETSLITGTGRIDNTNSIAEYYWDGTGTAWASASAWTLVKGNPAENPALDPNDTNIAFFGADDLVDDQTVQLVGERGLAGATFTSPVAFNFTGGGTNSTLYTGSSGINLNAGSAGATFGSTDAGQHVTLALIGAQTWTNQAGFPLTAVNDVDLGAATLTTAGSGGFIFSGALTGTGGLVKQGTGYLQLDGANTFTGVKTVSQGSVTVSGDQSASTGSWILNAGTVNFDSSSNVVVASGNSVTLGNTLTNHTLNVSGTVVNGGELKLQGASNVNLLSGSVWTQSGSLRLVPVWSFEDATLTVNSGSTFTYAGAGVIDMNTSNGGGNADDKTFLKISGGTFTTGQGFQNTIVGGNGSANLIISNGGTLKLSADIATLATTVDRPFNVQVGSGGGIVDTAGFSTTLDKGISGVGDLTKAGTGTLTLTGANTYSGDTTVDGGTLSLAGANLANASSVTIASGAKLDLNFAGTDSVASLTINGSSLPTGTYSSSTHPAYITGTGTLTVAGSGFNSWALGLGLSGDANADYDHDGVNDAVEYVLGTDPKVATSSGITAQKSGGNLVFTFSRDDASETPDVTLSVEAGTTLDAWPQEFLIGDTTANSSAGVVVAENGAAADTVVVTIPTSAAAKLFARLKVGVTL